MASNHLTRVYDSILGLLSSEENPTPLVRLNRVTPFKHALVYAKLEWYNPFGAVKDRVAANLVRDAEEKGRLAAGQRLVEATSGNTGLGLAMVGNAKGYPLRATLSMAIPQEKRTVLRFFGTDVQELDDALCPMPGAPEGAIAKARETAEKVPGFVLLDQYMNIANPEAHMRTTGPEIWRQTEGKITHFVAGLGTCGTITGNGRFLKGRNPAVKVLGVYPEEGHDIPGVRSKRALAQTKLYFPHEYDGEIEITNREAYDLTLRLNREESIIAGPSSGMALAGAFKLIPDEPGVVAVVIFPDNIFKYASSIARHFPELMPPATAGAAANSANGSATAPSANEQLFNEMIENLKNPYDSVAVTDLAKEMAGEPPEGAKPTVIDVRPREQWAEVHVPGSINLPQSELAKRKAELPADREAPIVMVCGIGKFSKNTTLYLKSLGYRRVRSLKGGINEWVRKQQPTEKSTA
ncbi:MAG TPA: pyridoxal-phosphate dependent enzyme [Opitutus sp.]|nr:pyridoxal-phosphate dependent enzyme [Opitutus sp.]